VLQETEKTALRGLEVGSASWSKNPFIDAGSYVSTTVAVAIDPTSAYALQVEVADASALAPGVHVQIGSGGSAERFYIEQVAVLTGNDLLILSSDPQNVHASGTTVEVLPSTLRSAIRAVEITYTAIGGERDSDAGGLVAGRAGRQGSRGLDYRVVPFERTIEIVNAPLGTIGAE